MPFYQTIIHGSGFHVEIGLDSPSTGFYTGRKLFAANEAIARESFQERFTREEQVQRMISESHQAGSDPRIDAEDIWAISLWRYLFGSCPRGFIFHDNIERPDDDTFTILR